MRQTNHTTVHADYLYYVTLGNTDRVSASSIVGFFHGFRAIKNKVWRKREKEKKEKRTNKKRRVTKISAKSALPFPRKRRRKEKSSPKSPYRALSERFPGKLCEKKERNGGGGRFAMTLNPLTREGVRGQLSFAARRPLPVPFLSERKQQNWGGGRTRFGRAVAGAHGHNNNFYKAACNQGCVLHMFGRWLLTNPPTRATYDPRLGRRGGVRGTW